MRNAKCQNSLRSTSGYVTKYGDLTIRRQGSFARQVAKGYRSLKNVKPATVLVYQTVGM